MLFILQVTRTTNRNAANPFPGAILVCAKRRWIRSIRSRRRCWNTVASFVNRWIERSVSFFFQFLSPDVTGLSANHVIWWTEQHQHDLSETMVHSFFSRRLKEEKYQQIIPLLQLFLEEACTPHWITESTFLSQETCDLIDHYRQTMKERGASWIDVSCSVPLSNLSVLASFIFTAVVANLPFIDSVFFT